MGSGTTESTRQLLVAFCQEFFGSLFMYLLFFPVGAILGNSIEGWIFHFLAVICFDIITCGACANPVICFALFLTGKLNFIGTIVRIVAELLVAMIGFPMLHSLVPARLIELTGGPELSPGIDVYYGSIVEGSTAFLFSFTVLLASSFVKDPDLSRPLFATMLRILIQIGGPITGANFNAMTGFSWAFYTKRVSSQDYNTVYCLAPMIGGGVAAGVYYIIMTYLFPQEKEASELSENVPKEVTKKAKKTKQNGVDTQKDEKEDGTKKAPKTPTKSPKKVVESKSVTRSQTTGPSLRKKSTKLNFD